jgi:hypothetical protein
LAARRLDPTRGACSIDGGRSPLCADHPEPGTAAQQQFTPTLSGSKFSILDESVRNMTMRSQHSSPENQIASKIVQRE